MTEADWRWLWDFIDPLEEAGIAYAIVGSVASSMYGEPRTTNDVDIVIQLARSDATKLAAAFASDRFYVPPTEVIEIELSRSHGGHINVISLESMTKADFYPLAKREEAGFSERRPVRIADRTLWFAAPEVVIVHKLRFFRDGGSEKHLRDIRGMLQVAGAQIDRPRLEEAVRQFGLELEWRRISLEGDWTG